MTTSERGPISAVYDTQASFLAKMYTVVSTTPFQEENPAEVQYEYVDDQREAIAPLENVESAR